MFHFQKRGCGKGGLFWGLLGNQGSAVYHHLTLEMTWENSHENRLDDMQ